MKNSVWYAAGLAIIFILLGISGCSTWHCAYTLKTVMVPMRDGIHLATDVAQPRKGGPTFPSVVVRTVYGRGGKFGESLAKNFIERGYVLVIQDTRGRGGSEGKEIVFADDGWGERQDGADTMEWVKAQDWCNGKIGTWGGSALGITQVRMACATQLPAAQYIVVASSNFYGQLSYQGGVFRRALCVDWLNAQKIPYMIDLWHGHPAFDDFWKLHDSESCASQITAPAVHVGGWWDIFCQGTINNFVTRHYNGGPGAKGNQKLIMGAWLHGPKAKPGDLVLRDNFNFDSGAIEKRFMDYWLKGDHNGIMEEPAVNYYTLGDVFDANAPGNEWRTSNDWPPFATVETAYFLHDDKTLSTSPATQPDAKLTFTYDPNNPCPTHGGGELTLPAGPFNQHELGLRPDVLVFASVPLTAPIEVTGNVKAKLYVSSDAPDTDFTAKFVDIYPDGKEYLMLDGIQRVKFRNGFEKPDPLAPGTIGELTLDLWTISLIVNTGHKIGLHVSSSNYPRFEKNPNTGEDFPGSELRPAHNSVHMDATHPSALLLPVRP